tara:strand:+ start:333 stop:875 length:543 start_codon:yes stop_codon:yes gene_type:complete
MRIDEFDLPKEIQNAQKKQQELKVLAGKVKQMYTKALKNYDEVEQKNAEEFDAKPFEAYSNWFKHMFKADVNQAFTVPGITIQDNNIKKMSKLLTAFASQNYFLKPKTPFAASDTFLKIVKAIDPDLVSIADQVLGKYVRGEEQKDKKPIPQDMQDIIAKLSPEQKKQLTGLLDKAGAKK